MGDEQRGGLCSKQLAAPEGWSVTYECQPNGQSQPSFTSRAGKTLRGLAEVHKYLKHEVGEAGCNEEESLWLTTLERYGSSFRYWAIAQSAHTLPECPVFRPTLDEFSEPGRYVRSIMPQIEQYGICKVVPPAGWTPQPWSGQPHACYAESATVKQSKSVEDLCRELTSGRQTEVRLAPRIQPLQLFNKSFEQCEAELTVHEYKLLMEVTFPTSENDENCEEAERQFWKLMATRPLHNSVRPSGQEAAQLRLEARTYQEEVQARQTPTFGQQVAPRRSYRYCATVLASLPWELEGAPPVIAQLIRSQPSASSQSMEMTPQSELQSLNPNSQSHSAAMTTEACPAPALAACESCCTKADTPVDTAPSSSNEPAEMLGSNAIASAPTDMAECASDGELPQQMDQFGSPCEPPLEDAPPSPLPSPPHASPMDVETPHCDDQPLLKVSDVSVSRVPSSGVSRAPESFTQSAAQVSCPATVVVESETSPLGPGKQEEAVAPADTTHTCIGEKSDANEHKKKDTSMDGEPFPVGRWVVICGLTSRPELNGGLGTVLSYENGRSRYIVKLKGQEKSLALRLENLVVIQDAAMQAAISDAVSPARGPSVEGNPSRVEAGEAAEESCGTKAWLSGADAPCRGRGRPRGRGGSRGGRGRGTLSTSDASQVKRKCSVEKVAVLIKEGSCATPGCDLALWHMGPCGGELQGRARARKMNYAVLAGEADEADDGCQPMHKAIKRHGMLDDRGRGGKGVPVATRLLPDLARYKSKETGLPCALYASDIAFEGELPPPDSSKGEVSPTKTRSGVMDSLLRSSLLRYSPLIPGVNYPMVYIGGRHTFFCWHVEDNHLYATNYLQAGAPKVWFGVPKSHMEKMEEIWRSAFPHLFARHPDLHYWKTCIFSPMVLHAHGVPVYRVVHEAGSFIFTSPGAYHTGFNTGFNVAESTNFALTDWLPEGARCLERYRTPPTRDTTLLHDALLCTAAQHAEPEELPHIIRELRSLHHEEKTALQQLLTTGITMNEQELSSTSQTTFPHAWEDGSSDDLQCSCPVESYLCLKHATHTSADDVAARIPAPYIHQNDEVATGGDSRTPLRDAPCTTARESISDAPAAGGDVSSLTGARRGGVKSCTENAALGDSSIARAATPSASDLMGSRDQIRGSTIDGSVERVVSRDGPGSVSLSTPVAKEPDSSQHQGHTQQIKADEEKKVYVKFTCNKCDRKLKVSIPQSKTKVSTVCTNCKADLIIEIPSTTESQSGRTRHMTGGPQNSTENGAIPVDGLACKCASHARRLIVRHPLQQLQQLIDLAAARAG